MDRYTALTIIEEFQRWRRSEPPYDGDTPETHVSFPYSAKALGTALDVIISYCQTQFAEPNDTTGGSI